MTSISVVNPHSSRFNYLVLFSQVSIAFLKITIVLFGSVSHGSAQWPVKYLVYHLPPLWEFAAWHFGSDQFVCNSRGFLGMKFINSPYCSTTILLPPLFPAQHSPGKYETLPLLHIFSDSVYVQNRRGRRNSTNAPPHFKATTISDQWGMCPSKIIQGLLFPQMLSWPLSWPPPTHGCLEESMFKYEHEKTGGISSLLSHWTNALKHRWRKCCTN